MTDTNMIRLAEAARLIGVKRQSVEELRDTGRLGVIDTPEGRRYDRAEVVAFARSRRERLLESLEKIPVEV